MARGCLASTLLGQGRRANEFSRSKPLSKTTDHAAQKGLIPGLDAT